jgi:Spy/CpxP family protein refolding chaperone
MPEWFEVHRMATVVLQAASIACGVAVCGVSAQEAPVAAPQQRLSIAIGDKEGGAVFIADGDGVAIPMTITPGGGISFGGGFMGGTPVPADEMGMLSMEQFQKELDLVPQQREQLDALRKEITERRKKAMGDLKTLDPQKIGPRVKEVESTLVKEIKDRLGEILVPHQLDRLKQLRVQMQIRNRGLSAFQGGDLADSIRLTDEQKAKLAEKQAEANKELRAKIDELRAQLQQDVLSDILTPEQRESLKKLTGEDFKVKPVDPPANKPANAEPAKSTVKGFGTP